MGQVVSASDAPASTAPRLQLRSESGWRQGLANLLRKEGSLWWGTRLGWVQALIWLGILNGMLFIPLYFMSAEFAAQGIEPLEAAIDMFFTFAAIAPPIGAIILMQGAVITEKQLGTAAWILSKPASRSAFVLAKLVAFGVGLLIAAFLLPGTVAYSMLSLQGGAPLPLAPFVAALGIVALHALFYLTLALMLGTFFNSRGPVLAVPLALLFGGDFVVGFWPALGEIMPWVLGRLAVLTLQGLPWPSTLPLLSTLVWAVAFVWAAIWRFRREEF